MAGPRLRLTIAAVLPVTFCAALLSSVPAAAQSCVELGLYPSLHAIMQQHGQASAALRAKNPAGALSLIEPAITQLSMLRSYSGECGADIQGFYETAEATKATAL